MASSVSTNSTGPRLHRGGHFVKSRAVGGGGTTVQQPLFENCAPGTHSQVLHWLSKLRPGKLLDVPAGEGAFSQAAAEIGWQVTAADCEPLCRAGGIQSLVADMNARFPCEDASFDAVVCIDGIEHIERPFDFILECRRILKVGGQVIITTPNISSLRSRFRWLLTGFHNKCKSPLNEQRPNPLHHINMTSYPELRYQLHRSGFAVGHVTTNRIKAVSYLYAPLAPISYCATAWAMRDEETDPDQIQRNRQILSELHTPSVLFGETLIVMATKLS